MYDLRVCAACLATDVKMFSMSTYSLIQPYQLLSGVQSGDEMPQKLCWECTALVNKFILFRQKCERAHLLLQDLYNQHEEITEDQMQQLNRKQHQLASSINLCETFTYTIEKKRKRKSRIEKFKQEDIKFGNATGTERTDLPIKIELDVKSETNTVKFENPVDEVSDDNIDFGSDITLEEKSKKLKLECELCSLEFRSVLALRKHNESSHGDALCQPLKKTKFNECSICGKTFQCPQTLREHQSVHTGVTNYTCAHCSLTFVYRRNLWRHLKIHVDTRAFVCDICGKSFKTEPVFKDHRLTHTEMRDFKCEDCPKTYTTYKALWMHTKKSHSNVRPYVCDICNMSFSLKCELKLHIMKRKNPHRASGQTAWNTQVFVCVICKVEFLTRGEFLAHKTACRLLSATLNGSLHEPKKEQKARIYSCKMCSRSFTQYCALTLHVSTTHSESRPYVCEVCGKAFKVKDGLKRHLLVHTGEKLYKCDLCEKSFTTNFWRQLHTRRTHFNEHVPYKPRVRAKRSNRRAHVAVAIV